jgi:hypothetical protein
LRRHGNQIFKRLPPNRTKGKGGRSNAHTHRRHIKVGYRSVFNHIQEAEKLPESYKALEKAGFHFTDYYPERQN